LGERKIAKKRGLVPTVGQKKKRASPKQGKGDGGKERCAGSRERKVTLNSVIKLQSRQRSMVSKGAPLS